MSGVVALSGVHCTIAFVDGMSSSELKPSAWRRERPVLSETAHILMLVSGDSMVDEGSILTYYERV